jgi:hypothetical protein
MYKSKERAVNSFFIGKINGTLRYVLLVCGEGDEAPALLYAYRMHAFGS